MIPKCQIRPSLCTHGLRFIKKKELAVCWNSMANYKLLYNQYHFKLKRLVVVSNRRIKIWNRKKENKLIHHLAYTTKPREKKRPYRKSHEKSIRPNEIPPPFQAGVWLFSKGYCFLD